MNDNTIPEPWRFGPWAANLSPAEFIARCRSLRALARVLCGPRATDLCTVLADAEQMPWEIGKAIPLLESMTSLDRRRILSAYGSLAR